MDPATSEALRALASTASPQERMRFVQSQPRNMQPFFKAVSELPQAELLKTMEAGQKVASAVGGGSSAAGALVGIEEAVGEGGDERVADVLLLHEVDARGDGIVKQEHDDGRLDDAKQHRAARHPPIAEAKGAQLLLQP